MWPSDWSKPCTRDHMYRRYTSLAANGSTATSVYMICPHSVAIACIGAGWAMSDPSSCKCMPVSKSWTTIASFLGSCAGEEEREPGIHCLCMRQVPLVTCILLRYTKITVNFCLPAERPHAAWLYIYTSEMNIIMGRAWASSKLLIYYFVMAHSRICHCLLFKPNLITHK